MGQRKARWLSSALHARNQVTTYRMDGRMHLESNGKCRSLVYQVSSHRPRRWLYTLYLSVDANFKLRSKDRGAQDVYMGPGWAYVVEEKKYKEHIKQFANTKEVCTSPAVDDCSY